MTPVRSTLAWLQQFTTLLLLSCASGWLLWRGERSPWLAVAGAGLIVFGYSLILGLEFIAVRFVSRSDPTPRASWPELALAWLRETVQALRVFCWRQPFRWREVPDRLAPVHDLHGRRGIVFIHGFVCNRGFWTPWLKLMTARGNGFVAVNLEPVFGSIDDYAATIDEAIIAVTAATGLPPVLVCHSMGGVAARAWLRASCPARVHHVVTIGSPHHGAWVARFSQTRNGRQMAIGSEWLRALDADTRKLPHPLFTCWYSNCDNVVSPPLTATLAGADNRLLRGYAHVDLAFCPEVMKATLALL